MALDRQAQSLRRKLLRAIRLLPSGDSPEIKRRAVGPWRVQFMEMMFARKPYFRLDEDSYLSNLAVGGSLVPEAISPVLIPCQTRRDYDVYDYFRMWSSFPTLDRPGRRIKFLVRDAGQAGFPIMGLCCLSSAVRQLRVRDEWIGWHLSPGARARNLALVLDLSTCISVPPYSYLTAGKLLASMMASNEVRDHYRNRYATQRSIIRRRILTDLVLLVTSAGYGRNAPQYKGLSYNGSTLFQFIGYTRGYSTFQIPTHLYADVKAFVQKRRLRSNPTRDGGPSAKIRILRFAARELGISEEGLVFSGHRRAVFAAPLATNWRECLLARTRAVGYCDYPLADVVQRWKDSWFLKRAAEPSVMDRVRAFVREDLRMSRLLQCFSKCPTGGD
jgi:hypothetical protein